MSSVDASQSANLVWFEIPAADPEGARMLYSQLFGWKINAFRGTNDYWHIEDHLEFTMDWVRRHDQY